MGEVILGLPGPWAENKYEVSDHYTTKIGGFPEWPIPNAFVRTDLLLCDECGSNLALVTQVYAPVSSSNIKIEERVIYVFGCVMTKCSNSAVSWKAFRVQKAFADENLNETISSNSVCTKNVTEDLWKFDSEEDDDDIDLEELSRAFSEAATLVSHPKKLSNKSTQVAAVDPSTGMSKVISDNIPVLPCFYIYLQEEALSKESTSKITNCLSLSVEENQNDANNNSPEDKWEVESYEYDKALNVDRTYLKFKKKTDIYPEQCFRYSYGGKPLLATGGLAEPDTCKLCGGSRQYEFQLMPPLLYFLQEKGIDGEDQSLHNWNWMTLVICTCAANCTNSNTDIPEGWTFAEEEVVAQCE